MAKVSLLETITNRAMNSFNGSLTSDNYKAWFDHWVKTGEEWHQELINEGLVETAKSIRDSIDWQIKHCSPKE